MGIIQNVIGGALEGAGSAALHSLQADQDQQQRIDYGKMMAEVQLQKENAAAQFKNDLANAPLNRLSQSAQNLAQTPVPMTAAPVTQLSGNDPNSAYQSESNPENNTGKGLINMTRAQVQAYKDPDMLAQYDRQMASDNKAAQDAVAGKTRKMTSDEALNAALDKAKLEDPVAYAAGKAIAQDNILKVGEGDTIYDRTTGKVLFSNTSKADRQQAHDDRRAEIEADRNDSRERMSADRLDAMLSRLGKNGQGTSLTQNVDMLRSMKNADGSPAYSDSDIRNFIFNKKETSLDDLAGKLLTSDPNAGTKKAMTPEDAVQKAISLRAAINKNSADATNASPKSAPAGLPDGAVQIGTSGGKPVFQTPDGKKFVKQ